MCSPVPSTKEVWSAGAVCLPILASSCLPSPQPDPLSPTLGPGPRPWPILDTPLFVRGKRALHRPPSNREAIVGTRRHRSMSSGRDSMGLDSCGACPLLPPPAPEGRKGSDCAQNYASRHDGRRCPFCPCWEGMDGLVWVHGLIAVQFLVVTMREELAGMLEWGNVGDCDLPSNPGHPESQ